MGFLSLFMVASMPVLQFLLIGLLGAFLASGFGNNILSPGARRDINKVAFVVFTPSIVASSLIKTVTLQELISWWFMPVSIVITFLIGGTLGWIVVKILRPEPYLEGLVLANCSAGNLGNILLIIVPAICKESNNPFGDPSHCHTQGLSFVSLSMALGNIIIWTHTYSLMRKSGILYHQMGHEGRSSEISNKDAEVSGKAHLIKIQGEGYSNEQKVFTEPSDVATNDIAEQQMTVPLLSQSNLSSDKVNFWNKIKGTLEELLEPPTIAAIVGLIIGVIPWLKSLIIGDGAPLRVIEDSLTLLGDGMLPCIILILGGNLIQGLRKSALNPLVIILIIFSRYVILPIAGIGVVMGASALGFLPQDPLFHYVLLLQFTVPPAMAIGSMAQLFEVAKEECSVIFLWTYLASSIALTLWSTVFMWLLF